MYYTNCMTTLFAVKIIARVLTMLIGFWVVCMWLFYILQAVAWVMLCVSVCSVLLLCSLCACVCVCVCVHACIRVRMCVFTTGNPICALLSLCTVTCHWFQLSFIHGCGITQAGTNPAMPDGEVDMYAMWLYTIRIQLMSGWNENPLAASSHWHSSEDVMWLPIWQGNF